MEFTEINRPPEFTLKMSLEEAIQLYKIVNNAYDSGNQAADKFVDALFEFGANSNHYAEFLSKVKTR